MANRFIVMMLMAIPVWSAAVSVFHSEGPQPVQRSELDLLILEQMVNPEVETAPCITNDSSIEAISGNPSPSSRWTSRGYIVQIDPASPWTRAEMTFIEGALYELSQVLCIPVLIWGRDQIPTGDYVLIQKGGAGTGCSSSALGRVGGRQVINLQAPGCLTKGIVLHENIHALGFHHEQTRPDRDSHIIVYPREIQDGNAQYQYHIYAGSLTFGVAYDTNSIMHYGSYDFSKNGNPTMRRRSDNSVIVKNRNGLTNLDVAKLRAMYNCH